MRKLITLFLMFFVANAYLFAQYQGGFVSATPGGTTIDPTASVTITYDGTGTNFANWTPDCHAHMWLNDASDNNIATTAWITYPSGGGSAAWALVPDNQKMTNVGTGKYQITIDNIFEYFNVAEEDKSKVAKFGIIVRAQYDGNNNRTGSMYLDVVISTPDPTISLTAPTSVFLDEGITFSATAQNVANPVITYSVQAPGAGSFTTVTSPYQPLVTGEHIFKAEVTEDGSEDVLASDQKTVLVKTVPADIVIRGKKPSDWKNEMHLFVYGTNSDGFKSMTKSGDWYVYTFTRQESVNIIFVNGDSWDGDANQTVDVTNVTESTCYQVGEADGSNKRTATSISCLSVEFTNLKSYAFIDDNITLSASSEGVTDPVYTYSVKLPEASEFTAATSPYTPSATGVYTFKVEVAENGDATVLASAEKAVTVMTLPTPITITVKVPDSWENTHFWYWTTFDGLGGWVEPTAVENTKDEGAKVYAYTFTRFDELNFLVANGDDWNASPVQTTNILDVQETSCYRVDDEVDVETGKYGITQVGCNQLMTSVSKTEHTPIVIRVNNKTIDVSLEKSASIELYAITGQLIRSAQNVNSFTQKVNSGVYVLRIDGETRKVIVND